MAGDPGGGQDRPLRLRVHRPVLVRRQRHIFPIVNEELFWGDAGIGMAIIGTTLAVARSANGTPEQLGEWMPQCFGTRGEPKVGAFCVVRARGRLGRLLAAYARPLRRGHRRMGTQRPEGVGDERRHRQRPRGRRAGRPGAGLAWPRRVHHPAGHAGPRDGHEEVKKHRAARLAHRRRVPRRRPRPRPLPARRQGEARRAARAAPARAQRSRGQAAMRTFEVSRPTVGAQALGIARAAYEYALDYAKERVTVRPADHREPGDRVHAGGHEDGDRRGPAARLAGRVDGPQRRHFEAPRAR